MSVGREGTNRQSQRRLIYSHRQGHVDSDRISSQFRLSPSERASVSAKRQFAHFVQHGVGRLTPRSYSCVSQSSKRRIRDRIAPSAA
jgi:hypothetical protein